MDLYLLLKLVHIAGAILWVGGASIMTILALAVTARGNDAETLTLMGQFGLLGNRVFLPISLVVIVAGLVLAWLGGFGLTAWTVLAFLTVVATTLLGALVLGPSLEAANRVAADGRPQEALAMARWTLRLIKLDLGGQWGIIALMVLKPGWADAALLVPVAILALGAFLFAMDGAGRPAPQAA